MVTFLDYGFGKVGGVEYDAGLFQTAAKNLEKLDLDPHSGAINCIHGDATKLTTELDPYNWFYFFDPFDDDVYEETLRNIYGSIERKPRRTHVIIINPRCHQKITDSGYFVLTNQFEVMTRQRVADVFVTKKEFEGSCRKSFRS